MAFPIERAAEGNTVKHPPLGSCLTVIHLTWSVDSFSLCVDACVLLSCISGRFLWTKYKDRLCKPGNTYKNVEEAQAACALQGSDWQGVYDDGCDGRGEAYVCKTKSVAAPDSDSEGWVLKPAAGSSTTFKPKSLTTLKRAVGTFMQGGGWGTATSDAAARSSDKFNDLRSSIRFEKLNKLELTVNFDDLQGSVVYAVRRMGWRVRDILTLKLE